VLAGRCHQSTLQTTPLHINEHAIYTHFLLSRRNKKQYSSRRPHNHNTHASKMPGFDFSNHNRNLALHARGVPLPKATSTGTTIVGALYDGGVVIAADTRATSGPIVADKVRRLAQALARAFTNTMYRTARSSTTSHLRSGVPVPVPQQTLNSPLPSWPPTSNSTPSPPAVSHALSPS
jgi:hypothetical protein